MNILDALYSSFFLRDIFSYLIPGSVLLALITLASGRGLWLTATMKRLRWYGLAALIVGLYVVGFALQAVATLGQNAPSWPLARFRPTIEELAGFAQQCPLFDESMNKETRRFVAAIPERKIAQSVFFSSACEDYLSYINRLSVDTLDYRRRNRERLMAFKMAYGNTAMALFVFAPISIALALRKTVSPSRFKPRPNSRTLWISAVGALLIGSIFLLEHQRYVWKEYVWQWSMEYLEQKEAAGPASKPAPQEIQIKVSPIGGVELGK